jgi:sugar phosphate isomerase/epimerase
VKPSLALQLYSLRREVAADPEATLRRVPALGYDGVELAGHYGWTPQQWRDILAETKLTVVGAHCQIHEMEAQMPFYRVIGARRLIVPALPKGMEYREGARQLNALGRNREFAILYHNHALEFADGGMDILLAETDPKLVAFEVDTYWVERAGHNAREFVANHAGRVGAIHAKELRKRDHADVPAGQGDIDFKSIIPLARQHGWPVIVEYEGDNALAAVAESARYLSSC